jgi:hypothetical protein
VTQAPRRGKSGDFVVPCEQVVNAKEPRELHNKLWARYRCDPKDETGTPAIAPSDFTLCRSQSVLCLKLVLMPWRWVLSMFKKLTPKGLLPLKNATEYCLRLPMVPINAVGAGLSVKHGAREEREMDIDPETELGEEGEEVEAGDDEELGGEELD